MSDLPKLPEADTASLAYSGRSVDYINGYESGRESSADQMRAYGLACYRAGVEAERERCFQIAIEKSADAHEAPFKDYENTHTDGYQDAANDIANEIKDR